uniref:Protein kinase domain-containing protein n=1 Tax=Triticum aestivum TaxID=4565 RepID=A0A077S3W6_WHEAT|nr:unnamed protein product [Triticum aestivum]
MAVLLCSVAMPCSRAASCTCEENKRDDIISYSFPSFPRDSANKLAILRDAGMTMGALVLTIGMEGRAGSVLLPSPITLWGVDSNGVKHDASFNTSFTMNLYRAERLKQGDGLAFVIVPSLDGPPPGSHGGFLGLTNIISKSAAASGRFVAIEFDTSKNDVVSDVVVSLSSLPQPDNITLAPLMETVDYTVWIDYNGFGHHIWVYVAVNGLPKPDKAYLDASLNMSSHVPQRAYIGFTASTGEGHELHSILSWNLTVEKLSDDRAVGQWKVVLPAVLGSVAATAIMISVAAFYFNLRYKALKMELKLSDALRRLPGTPKEFKYATIRKATNNYDEARKLGRGGFGAVYRGTLRLRSGKTCQLVEVAVKKFTRNPDQCYDDFLAEVDVINRLRHRNIVPLVVEWYIYKSKTINPLTIMIPYKKRSHTSIVVSDVVVSLSSLPQPDNITLAPLMETVDYTVWIDYNGFGHHIWVYVAVNGLPKPDKAYLDASLNMSSHVPQRAYIGFTASTGEGHELHSILSWNLTVEKLSDDRAVGQWKVVLPAVLGSVAATAIMISVAAFYFNLRYKALKMELKLSDALRRLPGTPKEFKYATIRKATNNYDEARKLGRGGFGAVYRGTLRLRSGKTCQLVEVAVKKFTRNPDQCYDDFLAEVDVINRLRHRNIVPLVGMSSYTRSPH